MAEGLVRRTQYWNLPTHTVRTGATGHGESLIDLEQYLLPLAEARGSTLHTWGVAQGLEVSAVAGSPEVTVSAGVALDAAGRTIVLAIGGVAVTDAAVDPTAVLDVPTVVVGPAGVTLGTAGAAASCLLTLTWREVQGESALANAPALLHAPWLRLVPVDGFVDRGEQVVLARLSVGAGMVQDLVAGPRRLAGSPAGSLELRAARSSAGAAQTVGQVPVATLGAEPNGDVILRLLGGTVPLSALRVAAGSGDARLSGALKVPSLTVDGVAAVGGDLSVAGAVSATNSLAVGLGAATSARSLHVEGSEVHSGGPSGGFSFADRDVGSLVENPASGQRWVWYARSGEARLWSQSDVLRITPEAAAAASVDGAGLDVFRRMRVRSNGLFTSGIWFHEDRDRGFVGMLDSSHLGFYGAAGAGWGLVMDVASADVGIGIGGSAPKARLHVDGFTAIRAAGRVAAQSPGPFTPFPLFRGVGVDASGDIGIRSTGRIWAGQFDGNVTISGTLSKGGGGFTIDHPVDPAGKYLSHSFVESPEMVNLYAGQITTDSDGLAWVELPAYFGALNRDVTYQLTPVGQQARVTVAEEVSDNRFAIRSDPGEITVCWLVTGVRQDPWANAHRIVAELPKPEYQADRFLHPHLYGAPPDRSVLSRPDSTGNDSTE